MSERPMIGRLLSWQRVPPMTLVRRGPAEVIAGNLVTGRKRPPPIFTKWFTRTRPVMMSTDLVTWHNAVRCDADPGPEDDCCIIALLTGDERAEDLRRLAEIFDTVTRLRGEFEQRLAAALATLGMLRDYPVGGAPEHSEARRALAARLHAAGWRGLEPDKTPDDALRMLCKPREVTFADLRAAWLEWQRYERRLATPYRSRAAWRAALAQHLCFNPYNHQENDHE